MQAKGKWSTGIRGPVGCQVQLPVGRLTLSPSGLDPLVPGFLVYKSCWTRHWAE